MTTAAIQPIAGVSAGKENDIEAIYPSIAGGALGGLIGSIMGAIASVPLLPLRLLVYIAVGAVCLPYAILAYALSKVTGSYYLLTNRSVQKRTILGGAMTQQVALSEIEEIVISTRSAYAFYHAGDVELQNASGNTLMVLEAVTYPDRVAQVIVDAREARRRSDASLAAIQARG